MLKLKIILFIMVRIFLDLTEYDDLKKIYMHMMKKNYYIHYKHIPQV